MAEIFSFLLVYFPSIIMEHHSPEVFIVTHSCVYGSIHSFHLLLQLSMTT